MGLPCASLLGRGDEGIVQDVHWFVRVLNGVRNAVTFE